MDYCHNCNTALEPESKFCNKCGVRIEKPKKIMSNLEEAYQDNIIRKRNREQVPVLFVNQPFLVQPLIRPTQSEPQRSSNNTDKPEPIDPSKLSPHPTGLVLIALYEISVSCLLIFSGYNQFMFSFNPSVSPFNYLFGAETISQMKLMGIIFILWGIAGLIGGVFIFFNMRIGYHLTRILLVTTGLVFFFYLLIPMIIMYICFIYFNTNVSFRYIFKRSSLVLVKVKIM